MKDLTHQNHFRFGYNGDAFNARESANDTWNVSYGIVDNEVGDFATEAANAARRVRESTQDPLWVMFSGGCDSEAAIRAFQKAHIPVKALICRFKNDINIHDTSFAVIACEALAVPYKFIDIDIFDFFLGGQAHEYAAATHAFSPAMVLLMWLIDHTDGYPIIGSGECFMVKKKPDYFVPGINVYGDEPWVMQEKERIASLYRHLMLHNRAGCAGFFQYTPEIMLSFLKEPEIAALCANQMPNYTTSLYMKNSVYYRFFPDMRKRRKFTGYEKCEEVYYRVEKNLTELHGDYNGVAEFDYNKLIASLSGEME